MIVGMAVNNLFENEGSTNEEAHILVSHLYDGVQILITEGGNNADGAASSSGL